MSKEGLKIKSKNPITVRLTEDEADKLKKFATANNTTQSALIRKWIMEGMSVNSYSQEIDFITNIIQQSINTIIDPKMERIIKLLVKTCVTSASSYYLLEDVIKRFVPEDQRGDVEMASDRAKKEGVRYTKERAGS